MTAWPVDNRGPVMSPQRHLYFVFPLVSLLALVVPPGCSGNESDQDSATDGSDTNPGSTSSGDPGTSGAATDSTTNASTSSTTSTSDPSSTSTSTTGDDGSAYGPCSECQPPNMCAGISADGGTFCAPPCSMPGGMDCPAASSGSATPVCALQGGGGNFCGLICNAPGEEGGCPTGMCCEDAMQMGLGLCTWGSSCGGGGSDTGTSGTGGSDTGTSTSTSG